MTTKVTFPDGSKEYDKGGSRYALISVPENSLLVRKKLEAMLAVANSIISEMNGALRKPYVVMDGNMARLSGSMHVYLPCDDDGLYRGQMYRIDGDGRIIDSIPPSIDGVPIKGALIRHNMAALYEERLVRADLTHRIEETHRNERIGAWRVLRWGNSITDLELWQVAYDFPTKIVGTEMN